MTSPSATLTFTSALDGLDHVSASVAAALVSMDPAVAATISVAGIDPDHADTAVFCEVYDWDASAGANCLVVKGVRGEAVSYAACVVPADSRLDVNRTVRTLLGARKAGFAPMDEALELTGMEYGGITPIGLPEGWRVLVDPRVLEQEQLVIGAGIRGGKLFLPGSTLPLLPGVEVIEGLASRG